MPARQLSTTAGDPDYETTPISEIKEEQVQWIFPGWIPAGKISLLFGEPGVGKSHLALDIAARLTSGRPMPLNSETVLPSNVLLFSWEDAVADTIKPRLEAAGADCTRIRVPPIGGRALFADSAQVTRIIKRHHVSLIIVDPLSAYTGRYDIHRDQHMRRLLAPLVIAAGGSGAAILLVHHVNKNEGGAALMRSAGSIGIAAVARSVMMVGKDQQNPDSRILAHVKSNLASAPPPIRFHFVQEESANHSRIHWDGVAQDLTADALLDHRLHKHKSRNLSLEALAEQFLRETLSAGPMLSRELEELAEERGISRGTFIRAKLAITTSRRVGGLGANGGWQTELLSTKIG